MSSQKTRKTFARKLRGWFRSEDWQHTPHIYGISPDIPTNATSGQVIPSPTHYSSSNSTKLRLLTTTITPGQTSSGEDQSALPPGTNDLPLDSPTSLLSPYHNRFAKEDISGDRKRTEEKYLAAVSLLQQAIKQRSTGWEVLNLPKFDDVVEGQDLPTLRHVIEKKLKPIENPGNPTVWRKGRKLMEQAFVVLSPFAKNLLLIAKEGQSVYCLVGQLLMCFCRFRC